MLLDFIWLSITEKINSININVKYAASLYDINGKLLQNHVVESGETTISMGLYISDTLFPAGSRNSEPNLVGAKRN